MQTCPIHVRGIICLAVLIPNFRSGVAADAEATAAQAIDAYVRAAAARDSIELTPVVDDDRFLRRISLDLVGRIPTFEELHRFRRNPNREQLVDRLLASEEHARFWSRLWTATLMGYGETQRSDREALRRWLESQFASQTPFDQTASELIAAEGRSAFDGAANFLLRHIRDPVVPLGRVFLGIQLDCARCHDHPTDRWTQGDFEGLQRFFGTMRSRQASPRNYELFDVQPAGEEPRFLTGKSPKTRRWRSELALWVTASKPFARAIANRLWYQMMGHGITNPPDQINGDDRTEDWPLVELLAAQLRRDGFCWRPLLRQLCLSETYQRATVSESTDWTLLPTAKPMTPDQLFDSLQVVLGPAAMEVRREQFRQMAVSASLDTLMANAWEHQEPVQSLMTRLNMRLPQASVSTGELFERILTRPATPMQLQQCEQHSKRNVMFALLNSNEFYFWH